MPDRGERIDAAVMPGSARHFGSVREIDFAVGGAAEYADGGALPLFIFREKIVIKRIVVAGEQPDLVPAPTASPFSEAADVHFGDQHEIDFVAYVMGDSRIAVSPHVAHRAW